ncbi:hypothetical protein SK128_019982, partial [Halocaridina rubra]
MGVGLGEWVEELPDSSSTRISSPSSSSSSAYPRTRRGSTITSRCFLVSWTTFLLLWIGCVHQVHSQKCIELAKRNLT